MPSCRIGCRTTSQGSSISSCSSIGRSSRALRGADPSADISEADRLLPGFSDTQFVSYVHWARAWGSLCSGRLADAVRHAISAVEVTSYFVPLAMPLAARAALWAGDVPAAAEAAGRIEASVLRGQAIRLDLATVRAGIAALEGRRTDAIAGYRDVLRGWRTAGLVFDEALAVVDMATVLAPSEREMPEAATVIDETRATLTRLRAKPFLERLDTVRPSVEGRPTQAYGSADRGCDVDPGRLARPGQAGRSRSAGPM